MKGWMYKSRLGRNKARTAGSKLWVQKYLLLFAYLYLEGRFLGATTQSVWYRSGHLPLFYIAWSSRIEHLSTWIDSLVNAIDPSSENRRRTYQYNVKDPSGYIPKFHNEIIDELILEETFWDNRSSNNCCISHVDRLGKAVHYVRKGTVPTGITSKVTQHAPNEWLSIKWFGCVEEGTVFSVKIQY